MKLKKYFPPLLILLCVIGMLFFVFKTVRLQKELHEVSTASRRVVEKLTEYERLAGIDSLVLKGDYNTAIASYKASMNNAVENRSIIPLRIALAEKLMNSNPGNHKLPDSISAQKDSVPDFNWNEEAALRKYDSLNFSLEKTKVQLSRIKKKLQEKSFGEYLTFTSQKGNQLHYIGQVKDGKANGYGVALLDTGSRYEGQWLNNQRHGEGTFYWPDGEYYVGNYVSDRRSGFGTYYWPNGEKYTGEWKNDKRSGIGNFYDAQGDVVAGGEWSDDKLVKRNDK